MATEASGKVSMTTIKVPQPLRQRIAGDAAAQGVTAAVFLARLLDRYERDQRFAQVRRAYVGGVDGEYVELTEEWDRAAEQDLETTDALEDD